MKTIKQIIASISFISISLISFAQSPYPDIKVQFVNKEKASPVSNISESIKYKYQYDGEVYAYEGHDENSEIFEININTNTFDSVGFYIVGGEEETLHPEFDFIGIYPDFTNFLYTNAVYYEKLGDQNSQNNTLATIEYDKVYYVVYRPINIHDSPTYYFSIKFIEDNTASMVKNEISVSNALVYPNPVMNNLTVEFETTNTTTPIEVYSSVGQLIYRNSEKRTLGKNHISIDMSQQPKGVYLMHIGEVVRKFVRE